MKQKIKKYFTAVVIFITMLVMFVLGFLSLETKAGLIFKETRHWQIAADEPETKG